MKHAKISKDFIKSNYPEIAQEVSDVLSISNFQYSNEKRVVNFIKKMLTAQLINQTADIEKTLGTAILDAVVDYELYSGFSIDNASFDKVLVLNSYLGIFTQGKEIEGGNVFYRKDKMICSFYEKGLLAVAYDKNKINESHIKSNIISIFKTAPNELTSDEAVAVVYRAQNENTNSNKFDKTSGFSNFAINEVVEDSMKEDFLSNLHCLFVLKNLAYKSLAFYEGEYALNSFKSCEKISVELTKEKVSKLIALDYIDKFFNLTEKGRLVIALCNLNFPLTTFGTSTILNFKKTNVFKLLMSVGDTQDVLSLDDVLFFKKNKLESLFVVPTSLPKSTHHLNLLDSKEGKQIIYAHSERLNFYFEGCLAKIYKKAFSNDSLNFISASNTYFSTFKDDTVVGCPTILYNTICSLYPSITVYADAQSNGADKSEVAHLYFYDGEEIIATIKGFSEYYNEFNLATQFEYNSYSPNLKESYFYNIDDLQLTDNADAIIICVDEGEKLDALSDKFSISNLYAFDKESNYSYNIVDLYRFIANKNSVSFASYIIALESDIEEAKLYLSQFVNNTTDLSAEDADAINKEFEFYNNIKKLVTNG